MIPIVVWVFLPFLCATLLCLLVLSYLFATDNEEALEKIDGIVLDVASVVREMCGDISRIVGRVKKIVIDSVLARRIKDFINSAFYPYRVFK